MKKYFVFVCLSLMSFASFAQSQISVKAVSASSVYPSDGSSYYPKYAIDKNNNTAWFPRRTDKANRGEWIKFEFERPSAVKYVKIINGWARKSSDWRRNSRVQTATITLSSGTTKEIVLKDTMSVQEFELPIEASDWITLTINDIYAGNRWNHEAGITQVSFYSGSQQESAEAMQIALVKKAKMEKENAAHLKQLRQSIDKALSTETYVEFLDTVTTLYANESSKEGQAIISRFTKKSIADTQVKFATSPMDLNAAFDIYQKSIFYSKFEKDINALLILSYEQQLAAIESAATSTKYLELYESYSAKNSKGILDLNPLISRALALDLQSVSNDMKIDIAKPMLAKYSAKPLTSSQQEALQQLLSAVIKTSIANVSSDTALPELLSTFDTFELSKRNKKLINESVFERTGIIYRDTFREGKIGERYVPALSNTHSYNKTRYINGVAINETEFENYTTGGYDESRYGFVAVYQFFNESATSYLVDVEITATIKSTEYKTKSSWSGDDKRVSVDSRNKIVQRNSYFLKAGQELKDQLVVGEEIPDDFLIRVRKITPVDATWIDNLAIAQDGDDIALTLSYFKDAKAIYWQPAIAANFARLSYMKLSSNITVDNKFDKDFKSPVKLEFVNQNDYPLNIEFSSNFKDGDNTLFLKANAKTAISLTAFGKREDKLEVTIEMLEPSL